MNFTKYNWKLFWERDSLQPGIEIRVFALNCFQTPLQLCHLRSIDELVVFTHPGPAICTAMLVAEKLEALGEFCFQRSYLARVHVNEHQVCFVVNIFAVCLIRLHVGVMFFPRLLGLCVLYGSREHEDLVIVGITCIRTQ